MFLTNYGYNWKKENVTNLVILALLVLSNYILVIYLAIQLLL